MQTTVLQTESNTETYTDIQFARPEDIPQIVAFAFSTYRDVSLGVAEPSFQKILSTITEAVLTDVVLVSRNKDNDQYIDGVIALHVTSSWWSDDKVLSQLFFYVKPDMRRENVFKNLLKAAAEYGTINNLPVIQDIIGLDSQRKGKILQRLGYEQLGSCYLLDVQQ